MKTTRRLMKTHLILSLVAMTLASQVYAGQADLLRDQGVKAKPDQTVQMKITGEEPQQASKINSMPPHRTDEPLGETVIVGNTRYDYQSNGSNSKMLALSADGMVHGSFMAGSMGTDRRVKAWCVDPDLTLVGPVNAMEERTGYTTHACTSENPTNGMQPNSGVVAMHTGTTGSQLGVDFMGCTLAFGVTQAPMGGDILWPHIALDYQDRVHLVAYDSESSDLWYTRTSDGTSWDYPGYLLTSTSNALGSIAVGSKSTDRACVLFHEKTSLEDIPFDMGEGLIGVQIHHDINMYLSETGDIAAEIDAEAKQSLTNFGPESTAPFGKLGSRAYCDVDGVFDYTEDANLHMAYTGGPQWTDTLHVIWDVASQDSLTEVYMHWNLGRGQIWHHNYDQDTWSHITGSNCLVDETDESWLDQGAWRQRQDRPSMAIDPETGYVYCVWTQTNPDDMGPVNADGESYPNADLYAACSADNGETWSEAVNLSNTATPDCESGDCLSENYHSLAEVADGYLHLQYVEDTDPGGIAQEEGLETISNLIYQRVSVSEIPPHDGTPWDAAGRVGLAQDIRWIRWYASAWCGEEAALDSVKWIEPVHIFNEGNEDAQVSRVSFHHYELDQIGAPEDLGLTEMGCEVLTDNGYIPIAEWDGNLPSLSAVKFNSHVAYSGLPFYDLLLGFHFDDGNPSLYYRIDMENALETEGEEPCTGVEKITIAEIDNFEEMVLFTFDSLGDELLPMDLNLEPNYPNPFNPTTTLNYSLQAGSIVSLNVYNLQGQQVAELVQGFKGAGHHRAVFDAENLASGVYFARLEVGQQTFTQKMILAR
jgi:hypothetical protein